MVMARKYTAASGPGNICSVTRRPAQFHRGGYDGFPREVLLAARSSKGMDALGLSPVHHRSLLLPAGTQPCPFPAPLLPALRLPEPCASRSSSLPLTSAAVQGHCLGSLFRRHVWRLQNSRECLAAGTNFIFVAAKSQRYIQGENWDH